MCPSWHQILATPLELHELLALKHGSRVYFSTVHIHIIIVWRYWTLCGTATHKVRCEHEREQKG